ncbi:unnamed protein product [Paramecium octaurelia]|uniref:Uncharacterized protein n=1 Tax=Paramecium octaurelia TaxID=43137 RepID=A0A8S1V5Z8_PAROT|nr:unnamed protein product [Paramecium octaurelia]
MQEFCCQMEITAFYKYIESFSKGNNREIQKQRSIFNLVQNRLLWYIIRNQG